MEIKSKEEAIEKTKWLRKKLNEWGGEEGFKKTTPEERIEFRKILISVENFLGIRKSKNSESRELVIIS